MVPIDETTPPPIFDRSLLNKLVHPSSPVEGMGTGISVRGSGCSLSQFADTRPKQPANYAYRGVGRGGPVEVFNHAPSCLPGLKTTCHDGNLLPNSIDSTDVCTNSKDTYWHRFAVCFKGTLGLLLSDQ